MGYLAAANTAEPVSKSALLFLEGIHQNSVNFDNPPLSPAHCQTQSVMGGEEKRREERRRELYLGRLKNKNLKKEKKKHSDVNLCSYCSLQTILVLFVFYIYFPNTSPLLALAFIIQSPSLQFQLSIYFSQH